MRSAIAWFGGKGPMVRHLLPLLPPHHTYVEPFGGAAHLLFGKEPAPIEVYNDLHEGLVNFWRVIRNPEQFEEFRRLVELTPFSRQEFLECMRTWETQQDPVERAYRWYVMIRQAFSASDHGALGWSFCRTESKVGMSASVSRWLSAIERLPEIHARLRTVQVERDDFRTILERYDTPQTLFYCDPPYVPRTRRRGGYRHEMTHADHEDLVQRLMGLEGKVILSGYADPVYQQLEAAGWARIDIAMQSCAVGHTRKTGLIGAGTSRKQQARVESIWISPSAQDRTGDGQLRFDLS